MEDEPVEDAEVALARMWQSLTGDLDAVKHERAALNATLRRWFSHFVLHCEHCDLRPSSARTQPEQLYDELVRRSKLHADAPAVSIVAVPPWESRSRETV